MKVFSVTKLLDLLEMLKKATRIVRFIFLQVKTFNLRGNFWLIFLGKLTVYCCTRANCSACGALKNRYVAIWQHPAVKDQKFEKLDFSLFSKLQSFVVLSCFH